MAERSRHPVLSNDQGFPITVLHVLAKNGPQRTPNMVPTADLWTLVDLAAASAKPEIEFIVLIPDELFVEITNTFKNLLLPTTVDNSVHVALIVWLVRACPANSDARMKHSANCSFHESRGCGLHWAADIVRPGFFHDSQALPHI